MHLAQIIITEEELQTQELEVTVAFTKTGLTILITSVILALYDLGLTLPQLLLIPEILEFRQMIFLILLRIKQENLLT